MSANIERIRIFLFLFFSYFLDYPELDAVITYTDTVQRHIFYTIMVL